jgi:hypothetical protein
MDLAGAVGDAEVAGDDEMPGLTGVAGAAEGGENGVIDGVFGTLKFDPGAAVTDTRDPPSAMKNVFELLGGIHWMINDPAV